MKQTGPSSGTPEQLDDRDRELSEGESYLIATTHRLLKKPVDEFSVEDFRILLGQRVSPEHLVPKALDILARDPMAEGDYYPGDLFNAVAQQAEEFWGLHPALARRAHEVAIEAARRMRAQWSTRIDEARNLYGASLDENSVSQKEEREFLAKAEQMAAQWSRLPTRRE